jgi:hypothetical protein
VSRIGGWAAALAEVSLPAGPGGQPVVLGVDDASIEAAGVRLGLPPAGAVADLVQAVRAEYEISAEGIRRMDRATREPGRGESPPPGLALACVCVVAASRMDADARPTSVYHARLRELLGVGGEGIISGFESLGLVLDRIGEWLDALGGTRGRLARPSRLPHHRYVDVPISQTLLRRRDRTVLGEFFAARARALANPAVDPLALMFDWEGGARLTSPARQALGDAYLADLLRGLIRREFTAWDGTGRAPGGRPRLPAQLRLSLRADGGAAVLIAHARPDGPHLDLRGGGNERLGLPAAPGEAVLGQPTLAALADGPVTLIARDGAAELHLPGARQGLLIFEETSAGLLRVPSALSAQVFALGPGPALAGGALAANRRQATGLPAGWALAGPIAPEDLPDGLRQVLAGGGEPVELVGGLPLGDGIYLAGRRPRLAAADDLAGPRTIVLDGARVGEIAPGEIFALPEQAGELGVHEVEVGGVCRGYQILTRGPRAGWGQIGWAPGAAVAGLTHTGEELVGPRIPGVPAPPPAQVIAVGAARVELVLADGSIRPAAPPAYPPWLTDPDAPGGTPLVRWWGIPGDVNVEWAIIDQRNRRRAIRLGRGAPAPNDRAAVIIARLADAVPEADPSLPAIGVAAEWQTLVARARAALS